MSTNPKSHAGKSNGRSLQRSEHFYKSYHNSKRGLNLKKGIYKAHMGVMARCPPTFARIV